MCSQTELTDTAVDGELTATEVLLIETEQVTVSNRSGHNKLKRLQAELIPQPRVRVSL